eukprot:scaffold529_cov308-Pinguiococcus_pyrenoidosus.AAC.16
MIEHQHWVVHVQFTCRSSFHELLSGSLAGEAKFWDLRYTGKGSIRTIEVQRSPMTALALHPCAPIMASGSHKQFIKILDSEGDQLGMIKHHNNFMGQRVGPVSCLAFHPYKLLLAGGATDTPLCELRHVSLVPLDLLTTARFSRHGSAGPKGTRLALSKESCRCAGTVFALLQTHGRVGPPTLRSLGPAEQRPAFLHPILFLLIASDGHLLVL